jgi:hypothetical protein
VHAYTPLIPELLKNHVYRKPGIKIPKWLQAEPTAGCPMDEGAASIAACAANSQGQLEQAATAAVTPGITFQITQQELPTKSSVNYSKNTPGTVPPRKSVSTGAVVNAARSRREPESEESKRQRISKAMAKLPDYADGDLAKVVVVTVDEIRQVRVQ